MNKKERQFKVHEGKAKKIRSRINEERRLRIPKMLDKYSPLVSKS